MLNVLKAKWMNDFESCSSFCKVSLEDSDLNIWFDLRWFSDLNKASFEFWRACHAFCRYFYFTARKWWQQESWHLRNVRTIFLSSSIITSSAWTAQEFAASNGDLTPVFKLERKHLAGRSKPRYLAMMHGGAADRHLIIKIYFGSGSWPLVAAAAWSMGLINNSLGCFLQDSSQPRPAQASPVIHGQQIPIVIYQP